MKTAQDKTALLSEMHAGYDAFVRLLALISDEQMTTPGVNGKWSIKDNIAHLTVWQQNIIEALQAIRQNTSVSLPSPETTEDELNEQYYQQHKDQPLDSVLAEFHETSKRFIEEVQATDEEDLRKRISWLNRRPVWGFIPGNQYEHFQEHAHIIRVWLAQQSKGKTEPSA
jgi:hypothetical protein